MTDTEPILIFLGSLALLLILIQLGCLLAALRRQNDALADLVQETKLHTRAVLNTFDLVQRIHNQRVADDAVSEVLRHIEDQERGS